MRGKHKLRVNKTPIIIRLNIESFIKSLSSEPTHYGRNKNKKYLVPEFGSVANIHRLYLDIYPEFKEKISYKIFLEI